MPVRSCCAAQGLNRHSIQKEALRCSVDDFFSNKKSFFLWEILSLMISTHAEPESKLEPWRSTYRRYQSRISAWCYTLASPHCKPFLLHDPYLLGALHCCGNTHKVDQITVCQACAGRHLHGSLLIPPPSSVTLLLLLRCVSSYRCIRVFVLLRFFRDKRVS